jgi:hypothetical protein
LGQLRGEDVSGLDLLGIRHVRRHAKDASQSVHPRWLFHILRREVLPAVGVGVEVWEKVSRRLQPTALAEWIAVGAANKAVVVVDGLFGAFTAAAAAEEQEQ